MYCPRRPLARNRAGAVSASWASLTAVRLASQQSSLRPTLYALTKSAHLSLMRGRARELGPDNITVNLVQPRPIDTELNPANGDYAEMNSA